MANRGYTTVAITLHWVIAVAILANLGLGIWMGWAINKPALQSTAINAFQFHKSLGLSVLVLSVMRLAWRLLYPPPPLPAGMKFWEKALAAITHWLLYALLILLPLSGWAYVSAQWRGDSPFNIPTLWFGLFEVPHLFSLDEGGAIMRRQAAEAALNGHGAMAIALIVLLLLHVGAALKHHFIHDDGVLARMMPWLASAERASVLAPRMHNVVAAVASLVIAALLVVYGLTVRVVPEEAVAERGTLAGELRVLVAEQGADVAAWQVVGDASRIGFAGVHAGRAFEGHFDEWQAAFHIDPAAPERGFVAAVVSTASATDGVPLHDRSLPQEEWFDIANHPFATYRSTAIEAVGDGRFAVTGVLTIKGHAVELPPLTLILGEDQLTIAGELTIDRAAVDMGMVSDPGGQYVSRNINIAVDVAAAAP